MKAGGGWKHRRPWVFHRSLYYSVNPSSGLPWAPCKALALGLVASRRHQSLTAPPAAGSRKCRAGALSRQLQIPAGAAAKVPRLSGTPRAEPLGRCSPGRSGNLHKLPGASDPDTRWEMARAEAEAEGGWGWKGDGAGQRAAGGWGQASRGQRHPFHSALALDPETAAAAEARAPDPGILARILREKQVESRVGASDP